MYLVLCRSNLYISLELGINFKTDEVVFYPGFLDSYIPSVILGDNSPLFKNLECMRQLSCSALRNIRVSYMDNIFSSVRCI